MFYEWPAARFFVAALDASPIAVVALGLFGLSFGAALARRDARIIWVSELTLPSLQLGVNVGLFALADLIIELLGHSEINDSRVALNQAAILMAVLFSGLCLSAIPAVALSLEGLDRHVPTKPIFSKAVAAVSLVTLGTVTAMWASGNDVAGVLDEIPPPYYDFSAVMWLGISTPLVAAAYNAFSLWRRRTTSQGHRIVTASAALLGASALAGGWIGHLHGHVEPDQVMQLGLVSSARLAEFLCIVNVPSLFSCWLVELARGSRER